MSPSLSVVVPVYNVSDYLIPCLESLTAQTAPDLEVILVDDGSTDASGAMADEFAAGRPGWTVLHVENGGLGRARNIGLDHSTADFVAFVDSDDLVPRDAYELMLHAARESGSDMVCGGVLRYDGARTLPSPLHRRAITRTRMRTHIRKMPWLIYDTTAWNKLYRRDFLLAHGLRFPEGVFYEDIPLTVPAHFLASSVDVLTDPVYLWRERQTVTQSITQRRAETQNLVDRMAAVSSVDDFLTGTGEHEGKAVHDAKVLTLDIPLFLDVIHQGDEEFRAQLIKLAGAYLERVSPEVMAKLIPIRRLQYHLIGRGMLDELLQLQENQRAPKNRGLFVRSGLRMYADLPFRTDATKAIPPSVYEVTRSQPLRTGVRDVRWDGRDLLVDGHAFIHRVPEPNRLASVRRFQLRRVNSGDLTRHTVGARRVHRPDLTGRANVVPVSYDAAGFLARIRREQLLLAPGEQQAEHELLVQVAAPAARRGSSIGNPELGRARHPARAFIAPGQLAIPAYQGKALRVVVRRVPAVLARVEYLADAIRFTVRPVAGAGSPDGAGAGSGGAGAQEGSGLEGSGLYLRRQDAIGSLVTPFTIDAHGNAVATVDAAALGINPQSLGDRTWVVGVAPVGQGDQSRPSYLLDLDPALLNAFGVVRERSLELRQDGSDGATLTETRPGHVVTDFDWQPDGLRISGITNGSRADVITLMHQSGRQHRLLTTGDGTTWSAFIPAAGAPGENVLRWLSPGRWTFQIAAEDEAQRDRSVRASHTAELHLNESGTVGPLTYLLRANGAHRLELVVDGAGDWSERGALHRIRARRYFYRLQRRLPLEDTVLFEAWKGRQYSDNPRAIFEELVRRGDPRRLVWAVSHHGVEVPDGVERVIVGTRGYFRHLGRARWLVSNDSMPPHYAKREGTAYAQTWHGTPLKRIGFDMENSQMANVDYLEQFAKDVRKWDCMVSPNPFSTQALTKAFRYDGEVLEIGYPRNDVFHREQERAERLAAVRKRLELPEDKRIILYAPTWRDNEFDANGRYLFAMKLDLERMYHAFSHDSVLLVRGHHLVSGAAEASLFEGFVRNVSLYPEISDLYLAADVLVTDYSSVMFDYVNTGRPMLFYTWDLETYRDELRGFYFDFEAEAPGPLLRDTDELIAALRSLPEVTARHAEAYAAFKDRFAGLEDGQAAARFVDRFLS